MTIINIPLDIDSLEITGQSADKDGNIILEVVSKKQHSTCHKCSKLATKYNGTAPIRMIRHLPIFDTPVYLRIKPKRYYCENCDDRPTTTEQYVWCDRNASITKALANYLMRNLIHSTIEDVSKKEKVAYKTIQSVLDREVNTKVNWDLITNIETIGMDEISLRKGHQDYVTIISAKTKEGKLLILGVIPSRLKEDVTAFLESVPKRLKKTVKQVCTDMYDGYVTAAIEIFGVQKLVIDRYHVAKLYRKPLDKLRIKEMCRLKQELSKEEYEKLEGMMWILRKNHECLSEVDKDKLLLLYKHSPILKKAHGYALRLTNIFNTHSNKKSATAKINRWIKAVTNSDIGVFDSFVVTLRKYFSYIGNYFKGRKNSGFVEGLNNKIKVAKRRCYGFLKTTSIFQRLFLDLQGFTCYG